MLRNHPRRTFKYACVLLLFCSGAVVLAQQFEITRSTIDGGGVMRSTSADGVFELSGTIGQPDAGTLTSADGSFELFGGFWFPLVPTDCDEDGCVTLFDLHSFEACLDGPADGLLEPSCLCFDTNGSNSVDLSDFAELQTAFSNP